MCRRRRRLKRPLKKCPAKNSSKLALRKRKRKTRKSQKSQKKKVVKRA